MSSNMTAEPSAEAPAGTRSGRPPRRRTASAGPTQPATPTIRDRVRTRAARTLRDAAAEAALAKAAAPVGVSAVADGARARGLTVRVATQADVEEVIAVQERANVASLSGIFDAANPLPVARIAARWRRALSSESLHVGVCSDRGAIVGVTLVGAPWFHALQIVPEYWGAGVAALLHEDALTVLRASGQRRALLRVAEANGRARAFWAKQGWTPLPWPATHHQDPPHPRALTYGMLLDPTSRRPARALAGRAIVGLGVLRD